MDFSNFWPKSLHLCLYTLLIILSSLLLPSASVATHVSCLPDQSSSLLQLKRGFFYSNLTSWQLGTDCCHGWEGVSCNKTTGHVTALDISNRTIQGNLSAAIFNLTSLEHLNLAYNNFSQNQIPTYGFEKLTMLTYLNLSNTNFFGQIPIGIANLTNLISLDLSCYYYYFECDLKLHEPNLRILVSQLSNLRELYLDGGDISENGTEWCRALCESVPNLQVLSMALCRLLGPFESCLSQLSSLTVIRLSYNNLKTQIPDYFAEFPLKDLQLYYSNLEGQFPHEIFHISTLTDLDISGNFELFGSLPNFSIVSSLESLVLENTNFFGSIPDSIGNLRNLSELSLSNCNFSGEIPSSIEKLGKLARLDLSYNSHSGSIPPSLFSLPNLEILYLYQNNLSGQFKLKESSSIFSPLIVIDLDNNQLDGSIPWKIYTFSHLETLSLSMNQFSGQIPNSIVWLSSLCNLYLDSNNFNGTFVLNLLGHLSNLTYLSLSDNQLYVEDVSDERLPLAFSQISYFYLASCNLNQLPRLLRYVGDMVHVDLSRNHLHGVIPGWIWKRFASDAMLNLSHNMFTSVEDVPPCSSHSCMWFGTIDFSFNNIKGVVPLVGASILDYSNNEFSEISSNYTLYLEQTKFLRLSRNMLTGEIPSSICDPSLNMLDLSHNNLSGSIPSCAIGRPGMQMLNLRENKLSGILSHHISKSCALIILDLNNNNLEGNLPRSLTRCKYLALLDIGNNHIGGTFPFSLGNLRNLQVIVLRSNRLHGTMDLPSNFEKMNSSFQLLRVIDLASNNLNGSLPPLWFSSFKSMHNLSSDSILNKYLRDGFVINYDNHNLVYNHPGLNYGISVTITDKGAQMTLENNIANLMILFDLSSNKFTGDIPETIGELKGIKALNLSHNSFTGSIPTRLGHFMQIESLDLSWNQFSGEIPQELISLNFLSILNLSFNHLVGRIPQSGQFLAFDNSSFEGNPGLCGLPLSKLCNVTSPGNNSTSPPTKLAKKMTAIVLLCLFIGLGFGTGFGIAIISPVIKRARYAHATR